MGKKKGKTSVVHWDKPLLTPDVGELSTLGDLKMRGTVDYTAVLTHLIDQNAKAFFDLGFERGKASTSTANAVVSISDPSGPE